MKTTDRAAMLFNWDRNRAAYWERLGKKHALEKGQCNPTCAPKAYRDEYMDGYREGMEAWWNTRLPPRPTLIQRIRRWWGIG